MRLRFTEWANQLDPELRRAISDPGAWFMALVVAFLVVLFAGWVPQTRTFFQLDWRVPVALFVPPFAVGVIGGYFEKTTPMTAGRFGAIALVDSAFFQLFAWSLVSYSVRPGNLLLAVFPVLLAAFHGHAYQASTRYPFQLLGTMFAPGLALSISPNGDAVPIFAVAAPAAIATSALLGTIAMHRHHEARERGAFKAALDAQILQDRVREAERYREMVMELRAQSHDAGNTLSSALINSEALLRTAAASESAALPAEAKEVAVDLRKALERLSNILSGAREIGNREALCRAEVSFMGALSSVLAETSVRFPRTSIRGPSNGDSCILSVYGGEEALHRILSNLVVNACEGSGHRSATRVWIDIVEDPAAQRCEIAIRDDGPGFSEAQLLSGVPVFETSKPQGSGLGLYTVERLVAANQGAVSKRNRSEGGAEVTVLLPLRGKT